MKENYLIEIQILVNVTEDITIKQLLLKTSVKNVKTDTLPVQEKIILQNVTETTENYLQKIVYAKKVITKILLL